MSNASCLLARMSEDSSPRPLGVATQQNCRIKADIFSASGKRRRLCQRTYRVIGLSTLFSLLTNGPETKSGRPECRLVRSLEHREHYRHNCPRCDPAV